MTVPYGANLLADNQSGFETGYNLLKLSTTDEHGRSDAAAAPRTGSWAAFATRHIWASSHGLRTQDINVIAGIKHKAVVWANRPFSFLDPVSDALRFRIVWLNSAGSVISHSQVFADFPGSSGPFGSANYFKAEIEADSPPNAAKAYLEFVWLAQAATIYFDDISLQAEQVSTLVELEPTRPIDVGGDVTVIAPDVDVLPLRSLIRVEGGQATQVSNPPIRKTAVRKFDEHDGLAIDYIYDGVVTQELQSVLTAPSRRTAFRYELLDVNERHKQWLPNVEKCSVEHNMFRDIKRTMRMSLVDDNRTQINWISDRIKPWMYIYNPKTQRWIAFALGVFLLSSPQRNSDATGTYRDVEGYDKSQILLDDKVSDRFVVESGTKYVDVIKNILGELGIRHHVLYSPEVLPRDRDFDPGTTKLQIVNAMLTSINYKSLWFNRHGVAIGERYRSLGTQPLLYTYDNSSVSVMEPDALVSFDLFDIPNRWTIYVSEALEDGEMVSTYTNTSPTSPTSTINRGRVIVDFRQSEAETPPDQFALDQQVKRLAENASQVFQHTEISTLLMPIHENQEVVWVDFPSLNINDRYAHTGWQMNLEAGGTMRHNVRRVVVI